MLARQPQLARYVGRDRLDDLGRALGEELVTGGETPLWNALNGQIVEERSGNAERAAGGVVVARTSPPQRGGTARFLHGFYAGLAAQDAPAVGVEALDARWPAVDAFARGGLSSVDWVDTQYGRLALVWLLAGGAPGSYGVKRTASDGVLPPASRCRSLRRRVAEPPAGPAAAHFGRESLYSQASSSRTTGPVISLPGTPSAPARVSSRCPAAGKGRR